jgi:hypothetical protein
MHLGKLERKMKKLNLIIIILCVLILLIYSLKNNKKSKKSLINSEKIIKTEKELPKQYTYEDAIASIKEIELKNNLEYLASKELEGRMSGKKGNVIAAEYIKNIFESYGLSTMYHKFNIQRMNSGPKKEAGDDFTQNIYAWIEGNDPILKNEIVVIGGHMDHIGYGPQMSRSRKIDVHPGADDNASGTVALIEIAEAFSMLKGINKRTVVFQAYSAEEMGLIGSQYYCNNPIFPKDNPSIKKHIFMLNMDMVGYLGKGKYQTNFSSGESSIDISQFISELSDKYSFAKSITSRGSGGSDHASFYNKKIPIAFLHTGLHNYYHTPEDTAEKINYQGVEKVAKYGFELSWKVVQSETPPKFNYGGFKPMEYTHDHGYGVSFPNLNKD